MSGGTVMALAGGVSSALVFVVVIAGVAGYNRLVRLRGQVDTAWTVIDALLRRRYEIVPALVRMVAGHLTYERGAIGAVVAAREYAMDAHTHASGPAGRARAEAELSRALGRLVAIGEAYPVVRANPAFGALQTELIIGADRIAYGRRAFNEAVAAYNGAVTSGPPRLVAKLTGFATRDFFEAAQDDPRATTRLSLGR